MRGFREAAGTFLIHLRDAGEECPRTARNIWSSAFDYIRMFLLLPSEASCMALHAVVETNLPGLTLLGRG
ncbi:MAG: hypothetical protein ACXWXD_06510, partial [Candidatus Deferrimicrobiaceae bacterium]